MATSFDLFLPEKMSDLPENLQIKRERSPPSTPEDRSPKTIKAKLNLHVKRRLQDLSQFSSENAGLTTNTVIALADIKQEQQKSEVFRQKRPYHKRSDKNKSSTQSLDIATFSTSSVEANAAPQRKYKHKIKQIVANENQDSLAEESANVQPPGIIAAGATSAGDEDDGGHENDLKAGREKEKCPDVLGMVLSMKKRALMQDPEVQNFLKKIMDVIKS